MFFKTTFFSIHGISIYLQCLFPSILVADKIILEDGNQSTTQTFSKASEKLIYFSFGLLRKVTIFQFFIQNVGKTLYLIKR